MTTNVIQELLGDLVDTHEVVLRRGHDEDPLLSIWRAAADDARDAYDEWCMAPSALTYATYLAFSDQEDAAAAALAADRASTRRPTGPHAPRPLAA